MLMDEFPLLGRLAFFEKSLRLMSGYGIKTMFVAQSLGRTGQRLPLGL